LDIKNLIKSFLDLIRKQEKTIDDLTKKNTDLESQLAIYKNKKNSSNSSIPLSKVQTAQRKIKALEKRVVKSRADNKGMKEKL
jgi:hypothetical protein